MGLILVLLTLFVYWVIFHVFFLFFLSSADLFTYNFPVDILKKKMSAFRSKNGKIFRFNSLRIKMAKSKFHRVKGKIFRFNKVKMAKYLGLIKLI